MLVLNIQDVNIDNNISMPIVHFHEHYEFYFLLSGTRNIFIRNEVFLANPTPYVSFRPTVFIVRKAKIIKELI